MAFLTLLEFDRVRVVGCTGAAPSEIPQSGPIALHLATSGKAVVIPDVITDRRFDTDPLLGAPLYARFYAGVPLTTDGGRLIGSLCVLDYLPRPGLDVGEIDALADLAKLAAQLLQHRSELLRLVTAADFVNASKLAMVTVNQSGNIEFANHAMATLFGYKSRQLVGQPVEIIVPERLQGAHRAGLSRVVAGGKTKLAGRGVEVIGRRRDGSEVPINLLLSVWRDGSGVKMGAVIRDVTERRERDARLLRLAHHDTLTGLCNRYRFEMLLAESSEQHASFAVMLVGLDGFKDVSDNIGRSATDALIQSVAIRLLSVVPPNATLARFAGDQFAILLPAPGGFESTEASARKLLAIFDEPFETDLHALHICACIGFAIGLPDQGQDAEEVLASADVALHHARQHGAPSIRAFDTQMLQEAAAQRAVVEELRRALKNGEFELHYQPQISLENGQVQGAEALLRWRHPRRGLLPPANFMRVLEGSPLALPVGWWGLQQACKQAASWRQSGLAKLKMSVNLFAEQLRSPLLVAQVCRAIEEYGLEPSALELEITERIALSNDDSSAAAMRELRKLGVNVAFDDFGTGYASLSSLQRFPLTTLKIDQSFVLDIANRPRDAAIVRALVTMSNELGLHTVAEGIETVEQEALLRSFGCRAGQGFRYGKPMPAHEFDAAVKALDGDA